MIKYIIIVAAVLGFGISAYIRYKKTREKPLTCRIGDDCNKVVTSEYSTLFGIPLEILGLAYYGLVVVYYGVLIGFSSSNILYINEIVTLMSAAAFVTSIYLTIIQLVVLKDLCEWCLTSAVLSTVIFILVLFL